MTGKPILFQADFSLENKKKKRTRRRRRRKEHRRTKRRGNRQKGADVRTGRGGNGRKKNRLDQTRTKFTYTCTTVNTSIHDSQRPSRKQLHVVSFLIARLPGSSRGTSGWLPATLPRGEAALVLEASSELGLPDLVGSLFYLRRRVSYEWPTSWDEGD